MMWILLVRRVMRASGVALAALAACTIVGAASSGAGTGKISGVVVDAAGRPIGGARVGLVPMGFFDLSGARFAEIASDADGSFRFVDVADGRYGVTATSPGVIAAFVSGIEERRTGVRLRLGNEGRHLSGRVSDSIGRPVAGAEIHIAHRFSSEGDIFLIGTGADGRWTADVPKGNYSISAVSPGYAAEQKVLPMGTDAVDLILDPVWPESPPPQPAVDWLLAHELPLLTVQPGGGFADLAPLRTIVGDARVVGLGEVTHGTREIFQLKHRVLEFAVSEMGFTVFAMETNLPESFAIDDYVLGGSGDPEKLLAGQFVAVWQTEEMRDLINWMREWNLTHERKVRFQGLDMRRGVRAAKETLAYLARVDDAGACSGAALALAPIADPFESMKVMRRPKPELVMLAIQARELLSCFESRQAQYVAESSAESWWRSAMQARVLVQLLEWRASGSSPAVRDAAMADNAIRIVEHSGTDARTVVWAHNAHVAGNAESDPQMLGSHLRAHFGAAYRAIGTTLGRGSYQAIDPSSSLLRDFIVAPARLGSLEATLGSANRAIALLDLRTLPATGAAAEWLHGLQAMRQFDGLYDDNRPEGWGSPLVNVARDYDALLFVANGSAARRLPFAREMFAEKPIPLKDPSNLGFEEAEGLRPRAWQWSLARAQVCGYTLALDHDRPFSGRTSAQIARSDEPRSGECAGQLQQLIDAAPYRGKRVRVSAAVRVERSAEHAHLYVESGGRQAAVLAKGTGWRKYSVALSVPNDASTLNFGLAFDGEGRVWLDSVSLARR